MRALSRTFLKGLLAILPLVVTAYLLVWLGGGLEKLIGGGLRKVLPPGVYVPGMGVVVGLLGVLLIGVLLQWWVVRRVKGGVEYLIEHFPVVGTVYRSLRDLVNYVGKTEGPESKQVVMVTVGDSAMRLLGLVTREDLDGAPDGIDRGDTIAVFLPWSYQVGGFTVYLPRDSVTPVSMSKEEALRWAITGGVGRTSPKAE